MLTDLLIKLICVGAIVFCIYLVQGIIHDAKHRRPKYPEPKGPRGPRGHDRGL
jgi:hypothetical protein